MFLEFRAKRNKLGLCTLPVHAPKHFYSGFSAVSLVLETDGDKWKLQGMLLTYLSNLFDD